MYCCNEFKRLIENAGKRGFSIAICEWNGVINFWFQARSGLINQQCEEIWQALEAGKINSIRHMSLAGGQYVRHCLYCGKKLVTLMRKHPEEYRILLEKHKAYVSEIGNILDTPERPYDMGVSSGLTNRRKVDIH